MGDVDAGTVTVTITADGSTRGLPVELELLDIDLPEENSVRMMVFWEPDQLDLYQGHRLESEYHRFAHRNRFELVQAYNQARVEANIGRFTGEDFAPARRYEGPGEAVGCTIVPRTFYGPGKEFDEQDSAWRAADS